MVQVVTGDSQEEVMIFRDKQTLHHNIYIIIIVATIKVIIIIVAIIIIIITIVAIILNIIIIVATIIIITIIGAIIIILVNSIITGASGTPTEQT